MKVLICGDSFAADWTPQYPDLYGWVNLLSNVYDVTNIAQAGVGEYKILKQLRTQNLAEYDAVIVSHTSPNRVHIKQHPLHYDSILHKNCDFIFNDIIDSDSKSIIVKAGIDYFKYVFDSEYYDDLYSIIYSEIGRMTPVSKTMHISFFEEMQCDMNFYKLFKKNQGTMNHLNDRGNQEVFNEVSEWLKSVY